VSDDLGSVPFRSVKATFALLVGNGVLNAAINLPAGRTTLTQIVPVIQGLENAIVARAADEAVQAGTPISCSAGCGACCRQLVPVSLFEAEALSLWISSLPDDRRSVLNARFHQALLALHDAGVIEKIVDDLWMNSEELAAELTMDYFRAHVACPFLENESCSIHPIRPLSCREYLVTSPPAFCQDPAMHPVAGVQLPIKLSQALYSFGREMEQDPRGWIPLVFLLAWGQSGAKPGVYVSGTGEEVLKKFLERVTSPVPAEEDQSARSSDEPAHL
jgi:Fe-S-cluster containining protein